MNHYDHFCGLYNEQMSTIISMWRLMQITLGIFNAMHHGVSFIPTNLKLDNSLSCSNCLGLYWIRISKKIIFVLYHLLA